MAGVQLNTLYFHQSHFYLGRIPCINPASIHIVFFSSLQLLFQQGRRNVCRRIVVD